MALYETTLIARQDLAKADLTKLIESFEEILKAGEGKIVKTEHWGLRTLAYPINKSRKGHYVFLGIDSPAAALDEMKRQISISEDIVRILTIKVDALSEEPTAMMKQMKQREERDAA